MKRADRVAAVSRELLEPLRRSPIAISSSSADELEHERLIPRLKSMVREVPELRAAAVRRRRYRQWSSVAAAAAVLVGVGSIFYAMQGTEAAPRSAAPQGATLVEGNLKVGSAELSARGSQFSGEAAIETPEDGSARFVTESGVEVALSSASRARLRPDRRRQQVQLMQGEVTLQVPRMRSGATVTVVTPDATVSVRGTKFSVSYNARAAQPSTCVKVTEGVVEVRRGGGGAEILGAFESSGCEKAPPPPRAAERRPKVERKARPRRVDRARSTLDVENRLLRVGLAAEQRNEDTAARKALSELLSRFPDSPLAAEARAALARIDERR